ncbi:hypothetical protein GUJ93_ZPchr0002g26253 [Zizania palustris]|uniref:Uncharacterized protein n=1 Tax=Zizania palustris TaxID=103762 RepID=A0A8J5SAA0_ZIZPA|nr:hypothetical protein GUJ93_ZPchr0002g26253 [Zizania palustris]
MKGGRGSNGAATDLLVCFPSRAHMALMTHKAICSPSRLSASEPVKRRHSTSGGRAGPLPPSSSSAMFRAASSASRNPSRRAADVPVDDEPSSPKVTCAGQIKTRRPAAAKPKSAGAGGGKHKSKATWLHVLGIKKDALTFLDAVHGAFRINVAGCFGSFPGAVEYTSGEDDDDDEELAAGKETDHGPELARWFMVLEEGKKVSSTSKKREQEPHKQEEEEEEDVAPPANALMLMRCRSAPAKGLPRRLADAEEEMKTAKKVAAAAAEEENKERLVLMTYSPDFFKVSVDIAKETWIVGGDDAVMRCRSWKR